MEILNLPQCELRIKEQDGKAYVYDELRKRYVRLTPEEWVRQHFVHFLIGQLAYPEELIANEQQVKVGGDNLRADTVVYDRMIKPLMILEYKAPNITLGQQTIEQVLRYNFTLKVPCLVISNGLEHYAYRLNYDDLSYDVLESFPSYQELLAFE